jgi:hypothetical protein
MTNTLKRIFYLLAITGAFTLFVSGCGGGGNESGPAVHEGVFLDSPVEGLTYETETQSDITDAEGTFRYQAGENITFYIGDVYVGQSSSKETITPIDLVEEATDETDPTVTNICRLLQSLDVDGDPDNGITISDEIIKEVEGRAINFGIAISEFEQDYDILELFEDLNASKVFPGGPRALCSVQKVRNHLIESMNARIVGRWGITGLEGAPSSVDSSNSIWTFKEDGTYEWFFVYPGYYDLITGGGHYKFYGDTLVVDGIVANIISENSIMLTVSNNKNTFSFLDDDGDRWTYSRIIDPNDVDNDGDGYTENQWDCNDADPNIYPGAAETCGDGVDQDCDNIDLACASSSEGCVAVSQGGWEFEWLSRGVRIIGFTDGSLKQSGCYVSYDFDNIFAGQLDGNFWKGTNTVEKFEFEGRFLGNPADRFEGTWKMTDGTGNSGEMLGYKGTLPR